MRANHTSWLRGIFALATAMLVAGPGLLLADGSCPDYLTPKSARLVGPGTVLTGQTAMYCLEVTFKDGSVAKSPPTTTWSLQSLGGTGTIQSDGDYTAETAGRVIILAKFENSCGTASGNRKVTNRPE